VRLILLIFGRRKADYKLEAASQSEGNYFECHVYSVSKLFYDYQRSLEMHKNTAGADFGEPAGIDSNMSNGFGIFAGYNHSFVTVEL